jgi:EAL domain-containing protein (putative c-di-GMP-specific phosphodiesterase class I)
MTQWIGATACGQMRAWDRQGCHLGIAINVSARNLHEPRLADQLEAQCRAAGISPSRLTLELTETAAMRDAVQMMDVLTRLRVKGFGLAIDDFGTGYSSLVQLHRLPFSEIKIDRTFVTGCTTSAESRSIVKLVVDLAHALGMKAVAEGVESAATLRLLREMGCDAAQGEFIAPPLEAAAMADVVLNHAGSEWYREGGPWLPSPPSP